MEFRIDLKMDLNSELSFHMFEEITFLLKNEVIHGGMYLHNDRFAIDMITRHTLDGPDQFVTYRGRRFNVTLSFTIRA